MKKMALILAGILLVFDLSACGKKDIRDNRQDFAESTVSSVSEEGTDSSDAEVEFESGDAKTVESGNILIAYFSVPEDVDTNGVDAIAGASIVVKDGEKMGNTEYVAHLIHESVGGDMFRIETVEEYPLDHDPLVDQAADEQDVSLRPELATHVENIGQYEYVFLGYPNWWGDMPQPLYTFLEEYDFWGKTIIPFITHGGGGASRTVDTISQLQPGAVLMGNELVLSRNDVAGSEETVVAWAEGLGISAKQN